MIDAPGVYEMPASVYHADPCQEPSLSSSIAKLICLSSPAHARHAHPRLNPDAVEEEAEHFDIGTAAHAVFLEGHAAVEIVQANDWRTNAAKQARADARAAGRVPLLAKTWEAVQAMVAATRAQLDAHTDGAERMFTAGDAERVIVWQEGDVWCRARLDWLRQDPAASRWAPWAIDDYKSTSNSANPDDWTRSLFSSGFDLQAAWYLRGVTAITGEEATFRFAVQETYPPYALSVISLGPDALTLAQKKVLYALEVWRDCQQSGVWPTYARRTCWASLPPWVEAAWLEKELR